MFFFYQPKYHFHLPLILHKPFAISLSCRVSWWKVFLIINCSLVTTYLYYGTFTLKWNLSLFRGHLFFQVTPFFVCFPWFFSILFRYYHFEQDIFRKFTSTSILMISIAILIVYIVLCLFVMIALICNTCANL